MTAPLVSVCIANYNGELIVSDCIRSVLAQDFPFEYEIVVHDDASTDNSVRLLNEQFPNIRIIVSSENVGFCISNNRMADCARGKYILLLNNDAALFPDALSTLLKASQTQAEPTILSLPQYDWQSNALVDRGCRLDLTLFPVPQRTASTRQLAYVIGACLWISRSRWNELGGFPDWMVSVGEDLYLCTLNRLRAGQIFVPSFSGYRHRQGHSFGGNNASRGIQTTLRRRFLSERNRLASILVLTPTPVAWPWVALSAALLLVEGIALSCWLRNSKVLAQVYLSAIRDVALNWRFLLATRRKIQRSTSVTLLRYLSAFDIRLGKVALALRSGKPHFDT